jgi:hypothetical protein
MAAQNELLAEAILEDKLVVIMLFQQLVYKLATSLLRTYLVDKLSQLVNKIATSLLRTYLVDKFLEQHYHDKFVF